MSPLSYTLLLLTLEWLYLPWIMTEVAGATCSGRSRDVEVSILRRTGRASTVKRCPHPDSLNFPLPSQTLHAR